MFGIVRDKILEQLLKLIWRKNATLGIEAARNHHPGASAHKIPCVLVGQWRKPFPRENHIWSVDEVGCRIDKRTIEVEDNGGGGHRGSLAFVQSGCKADLPFSHPANFRLFILKDR